MGTPESEFHNLWKTILALQQSVAKATGPHMDPQNDQKWTNMYRLTCRLSKHDQDKVKF